MTIDFRNNNNAWWSIIIQNIEMWNESDREVE